MLVRLVVITLCVAWTAAELQCPGPGRYSTTPGTCTSEYYTCNRDTNKEYIAYVLNCPGNTLFNERTRKCSSARGVSCVPPSHTTPSGQIKLATPRRQLTTHQPSSWISQNGYRFTTIKQLVEYRQPGRLPWVTARPYFKSTTPMTTKAKPQKNQWRIRPSTTRRTTSATTKHLVSPAKIMIRRTTPTFIRQKETATFKNRTNTVHQKITGQEVTLSTSTVYQQPTGQFVNLPTSTVRSSAAYTFKSPTTVLDRNENVTNNTILYPTSTSPITRLSLQTITPRIIYTTSSQTTSSPIYTTVKMKPVFEAPSNVLYDQQKNSTTSKFVTQPFIIPTSPQTPNIDYVFETTPETILKNDKNPIPFIDSLEPSTQNADVEIVEVVYNSSSKNSIKQMETGGGKRNYTPIKHIRYFYDPDINSAFSQKLVDKTVNSLKMPNKKNKQKTQQKKHRQPK